MSVPKATRDNPVAVRAALYAQLAGLFAALPDRLPAAALTRALDPLPTVRIIGLIGATSADTLRNLRNVTEGKDR